MEKIQKLIEKLVYIRRECAKCEQMDCFDCQNSVDIDRTIEELAEAAGLVDMYIVQQDPYTEEVQHTKFIDDEL